jgi:hypothetical protein
MSEIYNLLIPEKRANANGEEKTYWHKVGTVFPHRKGEGFNVIIPEGLAVSGRLLILPRKGRDDVQPDGTAVSEFNESA